VPTATHRIQLQPAFGFAALGEQADYLAALGISHVYLSPVLQAAPGSIHGYDVVDHAALSAELGGEEGFAALRDRLRALNLGAVVDVVPNHMAVPTPAYLNTAIWSVLRNGPDSPYAGWFDVDWSAPGHALLMPVLGRRIGEVLAAGEITLDTEGEEPVVRYHHAVFPVRPGTADRPLPELLERQWYRLAYWRVADEELNYRRFFDIDTLAGLRVEREEVFAQTHALLLRLASDGSIDGFRIDHPDGLADPEEYLHRLERSTGGSWIVVEKILEQDESLPRSWRCAGTTGYDAVARVTGLLADPAGAGALAAFYTEIAGEPPSFEPVAEESKRLVVERVLHAEVDRLVELLAAICESDLALRDYTRRSLFDAVVELLVAFPVYRAYVVPGQEPAPDSVAAVTLAAEIACQRLPDERHAAVALVRDLALGRYGRDRRRDEFVVRFQQTCGPVMAKGVEDTALYRWFPFVWANEVGGQPAQVGVTVGEFNAWCGRQQRVWPVGMTALSTHDTKRSEDVRARLAVLSEVPDEWIDAVREWRARAGRYRSPSGWPDPNTEYLLWLTVVGAWPIDDARLVAYLVKATREAKRHTSWTSPNHDYERAVRSFAEQALADAGITAGIARFVAFLDPYFTVNVLSQKLVQLMMPGVPDVYQGSEVVQLSLVDPDNRRPVDFAARRTLLARLDAGEKPSTLDEAKLLVVSRALRLRRDHPEWFGADATHEPLPTTSEHLVAFCRTGAVATVATRLPVSVERLGGWGSATVVLPDGSWTDQLTGAAYDGGAILAAELLATLPVALLCNTRKTGNG
jgi:(1->4)-alpha-D-glucan 1-alpha-D-glucosylmutase